MAATDSTKQLSPKVVWPGLVGIFVLALSAAGGVIQPEWFEGMGPWGHFLYVFVTVALMLLAAWWKSDPLRENYTAQMTAFELQRQREENPTAQARSIEPDDWATTEWPDNRG